MPQNVTLRQNLDFFNQLYNLRFFKNKRDLCDQHQKFDIASPEEKELQKAMYDHLVNKNITRDQQPFNNPELCIAVFDLQKVLTTPQSEASSFYYKRTFAVYDFTIYDIGKKLGYYYMWNESEAKEGQIR